MAVLTSGSFVDVEALVTRIATHTLTAVLTDPAIVAMIQSTQRQSQSPKRGQQKSA